MDGRGEKVNYIEFVTGIRIPATGVFLQGGSKSQVTDMNFCRLSEND